METLSEGEDERESPTEQTALERPVSVPKYLRSVPVKRLTHPTDRSVVTTVIISTAFVVGGFAIGLPVVAAVTVVVLFAAAIRMAIAGCCTCKSRLRCVGCTSLLSAADAFWLHDSQFNRYVAHCLFFVERGLDVRTTREILQSRVIDKTTETGERAFARFTQKVVSLSSGYCWVEDSEFDIEKHVFEEARRVRNRHQLRDLIASLMSHPLAPNRPLWEVRILKNFGYARDTVLIVRIHHALSDGISLVKILGNFLADHPQMLRLKPRIGGTTFPLNLFRAAVVGPLTLLTWLCSRRDYNPLNHRQPLSGKRSVGWSTAIRFATVDRIKQVTHCSTNDVLMAAARGAIREYFQKQCGVHLPPDVRVNIPLDLRYEPTSMESFPELGTGFSVVNARLPTNTEGAIPGLWEVHQCMDELKSSCDSVVMYGTIHYLLSLLPACLCQWLVRTVLRSASLSFCNLPGPERHVMFASCRLKAVTFWMNSHPDVPVAFCVFSYAGNFYLGVSADSGTVPSPKVLVKSFVANIDRMYSIVAKRKMPGENKRRSSFSAERRQEEIIKPSIKEINRKLHAVQDELHEITRKLELVSLPGYIHPSELGHHSIYQRALTHRMEELKEEFVELITELRRRKTVAGGIVVDIEDVSYDQDLDGELRRPRRGVLSAQGRRPSFNAFTTLLSTSRPLITQYSQPVPPLHYVPSDPDMEVRRTPEQQRALLSRNTQERCTTHAGIAYRRDNVF